MLKRLKVVDLNPHLSCILCGGYFIDATTITECLHSFCRACIVRYLETSQYCPVCEVQVHKSRPLRSDKILQDIVYKLVPGLFHNEMKRRRELYASQPPEALKESRDAEDRGECLDERFIYAPDEIFSLSIEYGKEASASDTEEEDKTPKRRFLRCPAAVTVSHLKKFVRMKYGIPGSYEIDLRYDEESLFDDYTLMDVAYIFQWQRKGPLRFLYKIVEKTKRLKEEPFFVADRVVPLKSEPEPEEARPTQGDDAALASPPPEEPPVVALTPAPPREEPRTPDAAPVIPGAKADEKAPAEEPKTLELSPTFPVTTVTTTTTPVCSVSVVPVDSRAAQLQQQVAVATTTTTPARDADKRESVSLTFKFSHGSGIVSSSTPEGHKPAVMTVAPLTKPSSTPLQATHGQYTGISIKKSPPNTLPPFKISSHLLPPRVPPLKLSPPRFSCPPSSSSSRKSSSSTSSRKSSKSSSRDKLEQKVAQLKSASIKSVAPLVITVPPELKVENQRKLATPARTENHRKEDAPTVKVTVSVKPPLPTPVRVLQPPPTETTKGSSSDNDDKMDLDSDLFEGRLVIAEPPLDSDSSKDNLPPLKCGKPAADDSEDEEIDVLNDIDVDSGRGSDVSRTEARSLCGDEDLGSPDSALPRTPEADRHPPTPVTAAPSLVVAFPPTPKYAPPPALSSPKANGRPLTNGGSGCSNGLDCGVVALDLSTCGRKRPHDGDNHHHHRAKQVANPAVLDKARQTSTPCVSPNPVMTPFKALASELVYGGGKGSKHDRGSAFKCRGSTLTVINPDPNGDRPKLVIRNLGPRPDRFHHHHHHHHQRM